MEFRIADTFTSSLARLTGDEQKAVKMAAFDLQMNPVSPGLRLHRVDRSRDPNFWSVRAGRDIRIIIHRTAANFLLCYADHHDAAYRWAERRKIETHPTTGAAQLVEIRETYEEVVVPRFQPKAEHVEVPAALAGISRESLLSFGVPEEWVDDVLAADEDTLLDLTDHLPAEASEALLELATGNQPVLADFTGAQGGFEHPDAARRFRVIGDKEELEAALEYPWDKWMVFLHPLQRAIVEKDFSGPARVSGSAGTGKTIVAIHRAVHLVRSDEHARVLLTTFSDPLANALRARTNCLIISQPRLAERIDIESLHSVAMRLYRRHRGSVNLADQTRIATILAEARRESMEELPFSERFLETEWAEVVDAWQLRSWEEYRDVRRLGRKARLPEQQRRKLWQIFERVLARLESASEMTYAQVLADLVGIVSGQTNPVYDYVVADEAQDLEISELRFLAALAGSKRNGLFFAGDLGQRIFHQPFSWLSQGVDVRGRAQTLRVNYRTSHQIRSQADRLLGPSISDVDGLVEERTGTVSVFNGPVPTIAEFSSAEDEVAAVSAWIRELNIPPHEIGVFVRADQQIDRGQKALDDASVPFQVLGQDMNLPSGQAILGTMHLAKGLEFRAVIVMGCDDDVLPLQERIERVSDDSELEEVYNTERHLLYVACTRARDFLFVSGVSPVSEFVDDLR